MLVYVMYDVVYRRIYDRKSILVVKIISSFNPILVMRREDEKMK